MKLPLPEQKIKVFTTQIPVRWGDMDAFGHLNNATYLRLFEEVRIQWLASQGHALVNNGQGPVVANVFCNFYLPMKFPGNVIAKLSVSDCGRSTFDTWVTMELEGQEGTIYAAGGATVIWIDMEKEKAVSLPDWVRKAVQGEAV